MPKNTWMAVTSTAMTMKRRLRRLFYNLICLTGQPCAKAGKTKIRKDENERRDLPLLRASVVRNLSPL
jgi:hypothetical protein